MARGGGKRRTYVRDGNGRFASTPGGGGGSKRPAAKAVKRGPNRLTRDNSGRITSVGGDGATVRGGRLKTAAGNLRGRQVAKLKRMQGVSYETKSQTKHPRIANRREVDQAHRDKVAKNLKKLDKETRRALASAKYGKKAISENKPYGSKTQRAIQSTAKQKRDYIRDSVDGQLLNNRSAFGRKALSRQERTDLIRAVKTEARGLRARQAVSRYGERMGGAASKARAIKAAKSTSTIAKPKGTKAKPAAAAKAKAKARLARISEAIQNKTGNQKELTKYNSRANAVRGRYVNGKYVDKEKLKGRAPLDLGFDSDRAYGRTMGKSGRRAANIKNVNQEKQLREQRAERVKAKQKAVIGGIGPNKRPTRKQRRSIMTAESAMRFYRTNDAVDTLQVNVKRPGFRVPRTQRKPKP